MQDFTQADDVHSGESFDVNAWQAYCPICVHFDGQFGVCSELHVNIESNHKKFKQKCNGRFFVKDPDKRIVSSEAEIMSEDDIQHTGEAATENEKDLLEASNKSCFFTVMKNPLCVVVTLITLILTLLYIVHYIKHARNFNNLLIISRNLIIFWGFYWATIHTIVSKQEKDDEKDES